ncbi:MAG TPA: hypothetical protein VN829_03620 [Dongiaceae bacterium]|nr:hypothetical protein [Dongiaceae bacterium]
MIRCARRLNRESQANLETVPAEVARHFGEPHRHAGLGLRKLTQDAWECRLDIRRRIVFIQEGDSLRAYDIMDHNDVRAWLEGRRLLPAAHRGVVFNA